MKVSVIFEDGVITVDGLSIHGFSLAADANWRALQWLGDKGWIEVHHGDRIWLADIATVQPFIDMHAAKIADMANPPPAPAVPLSITPRQCRLILLQQNLLANVEAMIAQQDEPTKITWEYASEFRRDDPLLNQLAANLNLTSEQIDQFFIAAAQL